MIYRQLLKMGIMLLLTAAVGGITAFFSAPGGGRDSLIWTGVLLTIAALLCLGSAWQKRMFVEDPQKKR